MIEYKEDWLIALLPRLKGSVFIRACYFAIPAMLLSILCIATERYIWPDVLMTSGVADMRESQLWSACSGVLFILLGFRTNRAMARFWEGTGLLHQMRGEWFDSVSCCVTFSRAARDSKASEVTVFRHTIVRLMSLLHGSALEEIAVNTSQCIQTIDSLGLDDATLNHLQRCKDVHDFNRVEVLLHLIQSLITINLDAGVLKVPPPILSRVYQTLSRGFVNLLNAKKIADTRFPFPFAQLIAVLLFVNVVITPLILATILSHLFWSPFFSFLVTFAMCALNFIGIELENPFGNDDNDLPLIHFQGEMNKCLLMLLEDDADLIPGLSKLRCITDFQELACSTSTVGALAGGVQFRWSRGKDEDETPEVSFRSREEASTHPSQRLVEAANAGLISPPPPPSLEVSGKPELSLKVHARSPRSAAQRTESSTTDCSTRASESYIALPKSPSMQLLTRHMCPGLIVPRGSECELRMPSQPRNLVSGKTEWFTVQALSGPIGVEVQLTPPHGSLPLTARDAQLMVELRTVDEKILIAYCKRGPETSEGKSAFIYDANDELYGRITTAMSESSEGGKSSPRQCFLLSSDPLGLQWMLKGSFTDHVIQVMDEDSKIVADIKPLAKQLETLTEYSRVRVTENVDVGLVVCALLCADQMDRTHQMVKPLCSANSFFSPASRSTSAPCTGFNVDVNC